MREPPCRVTDQADMDGYVSKPLCNDELFSEIAPLRNRIPQSMVLA